ncbi:MAG: glycosyltransferase family 1 protein [Nitrosarchaeum sp.]|nr:MAG: glycosyltransferase family 1 protein [Nitrosarchaeum sp.]
MVVAKYPATYGHTTVINNLCVGLNKIGFRTAIGAFSFDEEPPQGIEKVILNKKELLSKGADSLDFDIIHPHQARVIYYLLFKKTRKPIVFHYHAAATKIQEINLVIMMALFKKKIAKTICVSQKALNHLQGLAGKCNSVIIYNGSDTNFYNPNLPKPYRKGEPQLLFVSVLRPYKKAGKLIDAMPELLKKFPKAYLQIVGAGQDFEMLKQKIKQLGLENSVELAGRVTDDELRLRYSSCDLYISASTNEHCPVPTFEAMACGKPLVLSNLESHEEIIKASNAGLTFAGDSDICQKIEEVYKNLKTYGDNALNFSKNYDWSSICKQVETVYEEIK